MSQIIFDYTNAYDGESAAELYQLQKAGIIKSQIMGEDNSTLHVTQTRPVTEIMDRYGFTYSVVE